MKTIKKLPVSTSYSKSKTRKNEFLVPGGESINGNNFIGITTGEEFEYGAISYIGKEISAKDIMDKIMKNEVCKKKAASLYALEIYLEKLSVLKIGNIIKIQYLENGDFNLIKIADRPPRKFMRKLP